jgi:PBP1b-binding outer membrane lipoprotein LpoB
MKKKLILIIILIALLLISGCSPEFWAGMGQAMEEYEAPIYSAPSTSYPAPPSTPRHTHSTDNNGGYKHCGNFGAGYQCW